MICVFANKYAEANALKKPLFYNCWVGVQKRDVSILWTIILLAITVTHLPRVQLYRTTAALFHRTWATAFIVSKKRFKEIGVFLKVSIFETVNKYDKLTKVRFLHEYVTRKCMKLYQPHEQVSTWMNAWLETKVLILSVSTSRINPPSGYENMGHR